MTWKILQITYRVCLIWKCFFHDPWLLNSANIHLNLKVLLLKAFWSATCSEKDLMTWKLLLIYFSEVFFFWYDIGIYINLSLWKWSKLFAEINKIDRNHETAFPGKHFICNGCTQLKLARNLYYQLFLINVILECNIADVSVNLKLP